jgi:hypothetical protein
MAHAAATARTAAGATEDEDEFEDEEGDEYEAGDSDDEGALDDEELSLLEGISAAWSPSSSVFSMGGASRTSASTASSSRPIAIPAAT